jgi:hypothetical protein
MRPVHYKNWRQGDSLCARCGNQLLRVILAPDPDFHRHLLPLCGQCATPQESTYADTTGECPGCGMAMRFNRLDGFTTRWVTCSTRCYQRAWRKSRRIKARICGVCRFEFQSPRKDARFCSNACRQWHYRARLAQKCDATQPSPTQQQRA